MTRRLSLRVLFTYALLLCGAACLGLWALQTVESTLFQRARGRSLLEPPVHGTVAVVPEGLIGRLEIPRLDLSVIVMEGDDEATLTHAAGHLRGTALPWENGNAAIAAHRDTFFRPLKDVRCGDEIRVTSAHGVFLYRVRDTRIVAPDDLSVLAPARGRALTLVTCYPFYYIGAAPKRFIVWADRAGV
jgi:sortase A